MLKFCVIFIYLKQILVLDVNENSVSILIRNLYSTIRVLNIYESSDIIALKIYYLQMSVSRCVL